MKATASFSKAAPILSGLFGGMGGCAMIGQSLINIKSGGRGRTSGIIAAVALALFILFAGPVIIQIPIASLVGVMFMVVIAPSSGHRSGLSARFLLRDPDYSRSNSGDSLPSQPCLAVFIGIILSAIVFAWESSKHVSST